MINQKGLEAVTRIRIEKDFQEGLRDFFGVPSQTFLLDSQRTQIEF